MTKTELYLDNPVMNAAGTLGFFPDDKGPVDFSRFGAFITNPISWEPHIPTRGIRFIPYPGGFLLHTGYPNPGLKSVIKHHSRRWARSTLPIIVHLLGRDVPTISKMVNRLEGIDGVSGIEIGLPPGMDSANARSIVEASLGELPVIVRFPFEDADCLLPGFSAIGVHAVSFAPPRGILKTPDGILTSGRLYGPAIFPHALAMIKRFSQADIPMIGCGGITSDEDVDIFINAGAVAVQLDAILWKRGFMLKT